MSITSETIQEIKRTTSAKKASKIAFDACKNCVTGSDIEAAGLDNGWSMDELYYMPDGGRIWLDGRGWQSCEATE